MRQQHNHSAFAAWGAALSICLQLRRIPPRCFLRCWSRTQIPRLPPEASYQWWRHRSCSVVPTLAVAWTILSSSGCTAPRCLGRCLDRSHRLRLFHAQFPSRSSPTAAFSCAWVPAIPWWPSRTIELCSELSIHRILPLQWGQGYLRGTISEN